MAKGSIVKEKARLMDARWINTPFAFAQLGKNLSLLQMQFLLKVSEQLQTYINIFFKSGRDKLKDDPLSLFPSLAPDIPVLKVPYRDFNVSAHNRSMLKTAIEEVLALHIKIVYFDRKEQKLKMDWVNVFTKARTDVDSFMNLSDSDFSSGFAEFKINPEIADYAFNMRLGYVNHPLYLAEDSNQTHAPLLYFIIKHRLRRSRFDVTIPYIELRDELGMDVKERLYHKIPSKVQETMQTEMSDENAAQEKEIQSIVAMAIDKANKEIVESRYNYFSEFKNKVLDPAVADINGLADRNLLDIIVSYVINYPPGVTRGNPDSITFKVKLSRLGEYHKDPKTARQHMEITSGNDAQVAAPRRRGRPRKVVSDTAQQTIDFGAEQMPEQSALAGDKADVWKNLVAEYADGALSELLSKATYVGTDKGAFLVQMPDYLSSNEFVAAMSKDTRFKELLAKYLPDQFERFRIRVSFAK